MQSPLKAPAACVAVAVHSARCNKNASPKERRYDSQNFRIHPHLPEHPTRASAGIGTPSRQRAGLSRFHRAGPSTSLDEWRYDVFMSPLGSTLLRVEAIVKSQRTRAFVAVQRASALFVRLAVRIGCFINGLRSNPGPNALLPLQMLREARNAISVSDLLRNPNPCISGESPALENQSPI